MCDSIRGEKGRVILSVYSNISTAGQHGGVDAVFSDTQALRWFILPSEAAQLLAG